MTHPRTYAIGAYLGAFGASFGGMALAAALLGDREGRVWWPLSRAGSAGMLRVCGVTELRMEGEERLSTCSPAVVMANHESLFDPAVLMRASASPLRFIVKREVARMPVFGQALAAMGHVFVDRGGGRGAAQALERAAHTIASGRTVLVFPEGTRGDGDQLLPFRSGGFRLAVQAGVPILPVGLCGTGRILPRRGGWQGRGAVGLVVGEPISTGGSDEALDALMLRVRGEMLRVMGRAQALRGPELDYP